jgi:hypothetical protein
MRAAKMEEMRMAFQNSKDMCQSLGKDDSLDIIRDKVGIMVVDDTTFEMLTNQAKPNEEEKLAIQKWVPKLDYCVKDQDELFKRFGAPSYVTTINKVFSDKFLFLITDLYNGSITYGEFNKKRKELFSERNAKLSEISRMDKQRAEQMAIEERKAKAQQESADAAWFNAITAPARNPVPVYVRP